MKNKLFGLLIVVMLLLAASVPSYAQLTLEECDVIIEEIMKRLDIENQIRTILDEKFENLETTAVQIVSERCSLAKNEIKAEIIHDFKEEIMEEFGDTITQIAAAAQQTPQQTVTEQPVETVTRQNGNTAAAVQTSSSKQTFHGPHVKFVNAYAYKVGGSTEGGHEYKSEYYPNELFTVDVVFENDGDMPLPEELELRHTGNTGEYTGHTESAFSTGKTVNPGDRVGFSFAAHGSENIGNITFVWTLFDAKTGNRVLGDQGVFYYVARP